MLALDAFTKFIKIMKKIIPLAASSLFLAFAVFLIGQKAQPVSLVSQWEEVEEAEGIIEADGEHGAEVDATDGDEAMEAMEGAMDEAPQVCKRIHVHTPKRICIVKSIVQPALDIPLYFYSCNFRVTDVPRNPVSGTQTFGLPGARFLVHKCSDNGIFIAAAAPEQRRAFQNN